ncbi:hypothetical protein LXL04_010953 [Taraxacum kok-saghyz]
MNQSTPVIKSRLQLRPIRLFLSIGDSKAPSNRLRLHRWSHFISSSPTARISLDLQVSKQQPFFIGYYKLKIQLYSKKSHERKS